MIWVFMIFPVLSLYIVISAHSLSFQAYDATMLVQKYSGPPLDILVDQVGSIF